TNQVQERVMGISNFNSPTDKISDVTDFSGSPVSATDLSLTLDNIPPQNGRFENGTVVIGLEQVGPRYATNSNTKYIGPATPSAIGTSNWNPSVSPVLGNGNSFIKFKSGANGNLTNIKAELKGNSSNPSIVFLGDIIEIEKIKLQPSGGSALKWCIDISIHPNKYIYSQIIGGRVAGGKNITAATLIHTKSTITVNSLNSNILELTTSTFRIPAIVR